MFLLHLTSVTDAQTLTHRLLDCRKIACHREHACVEQLGMMSRGLFRGSWLTPKNPHTSSSPLLPPHPEAELRCKLPSDFLSRAAGQGQRGNTLPTCPHPRRHVQISKSKQLCTFTHNSLRAPAEGETDPHSRNLAEQTHTSQLTPAQVAKNLSALSDFHDRSNTIHPCRAKERKGLPPDTEKSGVATLRLSS